MTYELLYIIPATKTDEEVLKVKEEVTALIAKYSEVCLRDESLGKKKLAYPIEGIRYGNYVIAYFQAVADQILGLDEELRHSHDVLRHMITTVVDGAEKQKVDLVEYEAPDTMQKRRPPKKDSPRKTEMTEEEAIQKTEKASVTDEQLDKKLDEILKSDIDKA